MKKLVKDRESLIGWIFTLPAIIYMAILVGYSIIYNIVLSLQNVTMKNINGERLFVALDNYISVYFRHVFGTSFFKECTRA